MSAVPIPYDVLRLLWWALLGLLLIGFAVLDGYDFGSAMLLPFAGRGDAERRQIRATIEPNWEGHQVWFILGGGASFAAWPLLYAASFSTFYLAMFIVLAALILRPVAFHYRDKLPGPVWRGFWDWGLALSGLVAALVFGIAFGNLLVGVDFRFDGELRLGYGGGLLDLLNPFGLLAGFVGVAMMAMHGGAWLALKADGEVARRGAVAARIAGLATALAFLAAGWWIAHGIEGYALAGVVSHVAPSNPLAKTVTRGVGLWLTNYRAHFWLRAAPALGIVAPLLVAALPGGRVRHLAFLLSAAGIAGIVATAGFALFPFLLPSAAQPSASLTVWDASSSAATLFVMLVATAIFLPLIVAYTGFVLRVMRGTVRLAEVIRHDGGY